MRAKTKENPFTADTHLRHFADFCRNVMDVGGATPHLTMVGESARGLPLDQILWRGGCYAATYNYGAAEILWRQWEPEQIRRHPDELAAWVKDHWTAIPLRKERKAVNSPGRMADCITSFARWMPTVFDQSWADVTASPNPELYEQAWASFTSVRYMGRYIAIRFLEYARRYLGCAALVMPDLRPKDAPYPRQSLSLMYPQYEAALRGNDSPANVYTVHSVAADCQARLRDLYGVKVDYYTLQSLLCEYKQSVLGQRQYPGRSVDSEIKYWNAVYRSPQFAALAAGTQMWEVRRRAFPDYVLGELQGWDSARDILGTILVQYGYTWSDRAFDYNATTDFRHPASRHPALPLTKHELAA